MSIMRSMANARTSGSHSLFRHVEQRLPVRLGERLADRHQVIAGIEAFGDLADVLAQRLAIAQERGPREHVDLPAGIVDVILARHVEAGEREQVGQRIAEHRAAAMADVHRARRVGRDVFDVDLFALADSSPRP